jgi:cytochrome c oxidase assembly protein subunit 15
MGNAWLHRYSVLVLVCTFLLVIAGGLVTSNEAALAIPDWPLSYGKLVPPLEGGIRFEFAHRMLAATVALLTLILAFWIQASEQRLWLRRLGWMAVGAVLAQALLGGAAVKFVDPKPLSIAHACLAQICFGVMVAVVVGYALACPPEDQHQHWQAKAYPTVLAATAILLQTALGAAVRHNLTSAIPHIVGAGISTALVMWAGLGILIHHMEDTLLRRYATLLLSLTFVQVFLGVAAYMSRIATADDPQPMPMMIGFTVAHVAAGSLTFGAAVALALIVYRDARPANAVLAHGGMAVA